MRTRLLPYSEREPQKTNLVCFGFEGKPGLAAEKGTLSPRQSRTLRSEAKEEGFKGKRGDCVVLHPPRSNPARRILVVGLGQVGKCTGETLRRGAAIALRKAHSLALPSLAYLVPSARIELAGTVQALLEGALLADYSFERHRTGAPAPRLRQASLLWQESRIPPEARRAQRRAKTGAEAVCYARDLVNEPANVATPTYLADEARRLATPNSPMKVKVYRKRDCERLGMGALLAISRGSHEPPTFTHLHYKPKGKPERSVALVGKGLTFDSGGLCLKTAAGMATMKCDMGGAATLLGVFHALKVLTPPVEVHGLIAATENMPGGSATRPGDVVRSFGGKTIELLHTDAEGRVALADGLGFACKRTNAEVIIDVATLTSAIIIALGAQVSGLIGNNAPLSRSLREAASRAGEKLWELPLVEEYTPSIKSRVADVRNSFEKRDAGSIKAALFLREFVQAKPWAHLDIAGTAFNESPPRHYEPRGATGAMVRTLLEYLAPQR